MSKVTTRGPGSGTHNKCSVIDCKDQSNYTHKLPTQEETKAKWINFIFNGDVPVSVKKTLHVCQNHFTLDSYDNLVQIQLGYATVRVLKRGAVPTIRQLTAITSEESMSDVLCRRMEDFGCQTKVEQRTTQTQLTWRKPKFRSTGSQTCVLSVSICVGTPVQWKSPPSVLSSTRQDPFQPSKRRRLTLDEYDGDSTYIPDQSVLISQASPSINGVPKYVVDEDCLLQLFEDCPVCSSTCEVQKRTRETLLTVYQLCPQCHFIRNWKSQQLEAVPSGDPRSCTSDPESPAAAITEIIGFSDENYSLDEGSCEVDQEEHNSDSDWDPLEHHNIDGELADSEFESDADEEHEKVFRKLCPECGTFFNSQNQKAHLCEYKKPYSCLVCGKRFLEEVGLNVHIKVHKDGYKHVCKYCCSTFRTRPDKLFHEQRHPPAEKPYQCPDCPEVFAKILERHYHLLTHRGPTRHICQICNMEFLCNSSLERHVVVHTKAKQFVCEVCQRSFTQPNHLKSHFRVHTGEKPYQCQHCDKSFNHNVSLKSHIQRYHGQVPDPGMKDQMKKTSRNESEVEKDETNQMDRSAVHVEGAETDEMETSCVDSDEAEQSNTLCNPENDGDEEKKEKVGKRKRESTGRPRGRPKNAVITLDDPNQLKSVQCAGI